MYAMKTGHDRVAPAENITRLIQQIWDGQGVMYVLANSPYKISLQRTALHKGISFNT